MQVIKNQFIGSQNIKLGTTALQSFFSYLHLISAIVLSYKLGFILFLNTKKI
jgi:hypothetical protein